MSFLYDAAKSDTPLAEDAIASNPDIAKQLQARLSNFWLLSEPDGRWGPKSKRALATFKAFKGIQEEGLGKATATSLINTDPHLLIRGWYLDGSWASRTVMWYVLHNFYISTNPGEINICYFRGLNRDGTWNGNAPFQFNDRRTIWVCDSASAPAKGDRNDQGLLVPHFKGNWLATCDPGEYYWEHPMNDSGCADIKAWQYQAWSTGMHHDQFALIQTGNITVLRGPNRVPDTGDDFCVDQHSVGYGQDFNFGEDPGRWSAGCQVGASRREHDQEFMPMVKSDPREKANPGRYKHWTAVINGDDFLSMFPG